MKHLFALLLLSSYFHFVQAFGSQCALPFAARRFRAEAASSFQSSSSHSPTEPIRIVFLGDQGLTVRATSLLRTIRQWSPHAVVHVGDFDYEDNPTAWMRQLDQSLPRSIPYLATIGNHDLLRWPQYRKLLLERLDDLPESVARNVWCEGAREAHGVQSACYVYGIQVLLSGVGTRGAQHERYLQQELAQGDANWRICAWHKNMHAYQTGAKRDETGYAVYDTCRRAGAIIMTGHEHTYARTREMLDFEGQRVALDSSVNEPHIYPGKSIALVTGVGGKGVRPYAFDGRRKPWWARTAALEDGITEGALFCTFLGSKAECSFRDASHSVWDEFTIHKVPPPRFQADAATNIQTCREQFHELQLSDQRLNGQYKSNSRFECGKESARLNEAILLRFPVANLLMKNVTLVHLQVYGVKTALMQESWVLDAALTDTVLPCDKTPPALSFTQSTVHWRVTPDQELEQGEVWVSPNLASLVRELNPKLSHFILRLRPVNPTQRQGAQIAFVGEEDACLAPSLTLTTVQC